MAKRKEVKSFEEIGAAIGRLVEKKQKAYGDSFGRAGNCLRELFPDGIPPTKYDDVLVIARMLDKIFRIANQEDAFGENPYEDLAGYSILGYRRKQKSLGSTHDNQREQNKKRSPNKR